MKPIKENPTIREVVERRKSAARLADHDRCYAKLLTALPNYKTCCRETLVSAVCQYLEEVVGDDDPIAEVRYFLNLLRDDRRSCGWKAKRYDRYGRRTQ